MLCLSILLYNTNELQIRKNTQNVWYGASKHENNISSYKTTIIALGKLYTDRISI